MDQKVSRKYFSFVNQEKHFNVILIIATRCMLSVCGCRLPSCTSESTQYNHQHNIMNNDADKYSVDRIA